MVTNGRLKHAQLVVSFRRNKQPLCAGDPDAVLTSVTATLGATLSGWGEWALIHRTAERRAGACGAGYTPSGANTHRTGQRAPLAVMLWEPKRERERKRHLHTETQPQGGKEEEEAERQ